MIFIRFLIIVFFTFFSFTVSSDPFTNEIGVVDKVEKEEVKIEEEVQIEEVAEEEAEDLFEEDMPEEIALTNNEEEETENLETTENIELNNSETDPQKFKNVFNIDPIIGSPLREYILKGTALSKESKKTKFKRARIKKIDHAKIPTTHTITENDTIEKIAFMYGFPLREIELANAIYPGSRELVAGDKLVIPNRFHIIKENQTLNSIAEEYNINVVQLASYNDLDDDSVILVGDKLLLPFFIHVSSYNETMSEIAKRYEREVSELLSFNNLDDQTLILNENQLIKIPIYANKKIDYANLDKKSINDFEIDRKNLAIVQIAEGQYLVREGDRIGDDNGIIVSIESTRMVVLENNMEYEFYINTPITKTAIAQQPQTFQDDEFDTTDENQDENDDIGTDTDEFFND